MQTQCTADALQMHWVSTAMHCKIFFFTLQIFLTCPSILFKWYTLCTAGLSSAHEVLTADTLQIYCSDTADGHGLEQISRSAELRICSEALAPKMGLEQIRANDILMWLDTHGHEYYLREKVRNIRACIGKWGEVPYLKVEISIIGMSNIPIHSVLKIGHVYLKRSTPRGGHQAVLNCGNHRQKMFIFQTWLRSQFGPLFQDY